MQQDTPQLDALIEQVLAAAFEVANTLGAGFLEKVYERALMIELELRGIPAESQVTKPVFYKGRRLGDYTADIIVNHQLLIELKCADAFAKQHIAQCLNYLRVADLHICLLINFERPKLEWKRLVR
ncbi:MAG: GxxExxY protein [Acidobacteria bacterium]|nr:GxxExxY protein [Acidobacteriota bacterium]